MQKLSLGGCKKFVRSRSQQMPKQRASAEAGSGQRVRRRRRRRRRNCRQNDSGQKNLCDKLTEGCEGTKKNEKRRRRRRNRERGGENEGRGSSLCLGSGRQNKNLKKINIRKQQAGKNEETNERKEATVSRVESERENEGGRECEGEQVESRKLSHVRRGGN